MPRSRMAILGAGPIGLDAALAGVDAGWEVTVYEAAPTVAANVRAWGHVRLFTPWSMNVSDRMRDHLARAALDVPVGDAPTGHEFADRVLDPVAAALGEAVRTGVRVLGVTRAGLLKHEAIGVPARADGPFRLLLTDGDEEWSENADLVIDTTGSYGAANPLGDGGLPAAGEARHADRITRTIPDLVRDGSWAGRTTLLVGAGKSAQTAARDLAGQVSRAPGTRVIWAVRDPDPDWGAIPGDTLPDRQALVDTATALHAGAVDGVEVRTGVVVDALRAGSGSLVATLRDGHGRAEEVRADRVLGLTGFFGDTGLYRRLQVHECYATGAPMNLSAALLAAAGEGPADCLAQPAQGVDVLRSPEPDFFVLGMKSYGSNSAFLLRIGYAQVDEVVGAYRAAIAS